MSNPSNRDFLLQHAYNAGIRDPRELAAFMGQMQVESGRFRSMHEGLGYSAERLLEVFPGRNGMDTLAEARAAVNGGREQIADQIYGGRWGRDNLGNTEPGDGWRFHGRGYVQLTGRDNYERAARELGMDLTRNPDLAADRTNAANIAVHYWQSRVVPHGHQFDVRAATRDINGGSNHLPERRAAVAEWERMLSPEVMQGLARGQVNLPETQGRGGRDAMADGVLKLNERGQAVQDMQETLKRLGYRDAAGGEINPDGHFGRRTEEALKAFQRANGLTDDGIAGRDTLNALRNAQPQRDQQPAERQQPAQAEPARTGSLADPANRDNPMYRQAVEGLERLGPNGGFRNREDMERAAATLTYEARVSGLNKIDHVVPNASGTGLFAVQGEVNDPAHHRVHVDRGQAVAQTVQQTSQQLQQDVPQQAQQQQQQERQQQRPVMV
ncbi:peptidoglycan-binding protein [Lysobacter sp. BMK333-48F3]|uniref:XVIPCD domain-containing protein n=1 Tax=Lysobacter sp. BMK333-48F3 TaxID=2867962 RepID=UPI001C8C65D4|nr:XVIPCD domain-containing protein [Lysobacter sp. BMK333-48F3]MBX9403409.1 peptidoglycan-binding protein [Lysobacter sp. BMK333-48F3]